MFQICVGYHIYGFKDESGVLQELKQIDKLFINNKKNKANFNQIYESNKSFLHLNFNDTEQQNTPTNKKIGFQ